MSGRRILAVLTLSLTVMTVSACGGSSKNRQDTVQNNSPVNDTEDTQASQEPAGKNPTVSTDTETQVIDQVNEILPDAAFLSTYPGVFKCMSLTLEQILKVLGSNFQLFENTAQGYDVYQFPEYNLVIEYDTISEKLSSIRVNDIPYYVYSGTIKSFDIDNDGKIEEIAAYEDENLNGKVTVFGEDGLIKADQTTDYFDGKCDMSLVSGYGPDKESLIILDTRAEQDCEIFSYSNGNLISMIPPNQEDLESQAEVTSDGPSVHLSLPEKGLSYDCPIPERLIESYPDSNTPLQYRFVMNLKPVITDNSLSLHIRHSLEIKYYEDAFEGGTETYLDVAQVINEYQYLGGGKWEFLSTKGGPKYNKENMLGGLTSNDFTVGSVKLLAPIADVASSIGLDLSKYNEDDLLSGVLYKTGSVCIGITNKAISYISLENNSDGKTLRGLKTGDSKQQALDLYGLPDKGYFEDSIWTYYFLREENMGEGGYFLADNLNIEFDGDIVSKIWMSIYIPTY